jgi:hypothetical protein
VRPITPSAPVSSGKGGPHSVAAPRQYREVFAGPLLGPIGLAVLPVGEGYPSLGSHLWIPVGR